MKTGTFIAVTPGDPAGIGPEITLNSFKKILVSDHSISALVVGDLSVLRAAKERMNLTIPLQSVTGVEEASSALKTGSIPVVDCAVIADTDAFKPGTVSPICGKAAVSYIEKVVQLANEGSIRGLVTGPINKEAVKAAGYTYKGHTEMLKEMTGSGKSITMFAVDRMKIIFHTRHSSLREALETLNTEEVAETIRTAERCLRSIGFNKPNMALAALNPHASDGGMFVTEESEILEPAVKKTRKEGYVTNLISDFAIKWLKGRDHTKPFCLMVHEKAPHRPWMPDTAMLKMYEDENFPVPGNFFDDYTGRRGAEEQKMSVIKDMYLDYDLKMVDKEGEIKTPLKRAIEGRLDRMNNEQRAAWNKEYDPKTEAFKKANLKGRELAKWKLRRYLTDYLRCIASVDLNVGRILDYLDQTGLDKNTLIVYSSDQGFYLGEHGWFDKRFMYEESFRTPLLMRYPDGFKRKGEISELVQNIDFAPTFLDYAGVTIPKEIQGQSLKPLLENENSPSDWRKSLYYHYYEFPSEHFTRRHYGIRTDRYKLIHFYYDFDEWELFDLNKDPHEMNNVYKDPAYNQVVDSLKIQLNNLRIMYADTLPDPEYISK